MGAWGPSARKISRARVFLFGLLKGLRGRSDTERSPDRGGVKVPTLRSILGVRGTFSNGTPGPESLDVCECMGPGAEDEADAGTATAFAVWVPPCVDAALLGVGCPAE